LAPTPTATAPVRRSPANGPLPGRSGEPAAPRYDPAADLRWLLARPWIFVGRLVTVLWQLGSLALVLLTQGNSSDPKVHQRLGRREEPSVGIARHRHIGLDACRPGIETIGHVGCPAIACRHPTRSLARPAIRTGCTIRA
jgi:hypothetical protein